MNPAGRQLHLGAFLYGTGHHAAAWRHPSSDVERLGDVHWYEDLARTAERGLFDAVFFADGQSTGDVSLGPGWFLEPLTTLAAMARATERVGLVSTVSTTFWQPFHAARTLASLDHLSGGRAGWNVVTSMHDAEARNFGLDAMPPSERRYERAAEFVEAALALWDSWDADALVLDRAGRYAEPSRVHRVEHRGAHFSVDGPLTVPRSPQGRPVLFQAGASDAGRDLAAGRAEGVYAVAHDLPSARAYREDVRRRAAAAGRDPDALVVMPGLVAFVGSTEEEAHRLRAELDVLLPVEHSLAQLSTFVRQDCTAWDLDAPVPPLPPAEGFPGPRGRYETVLRIVQVERPTVRELLGRLAAGGGHCTVVGAPEQVADRVEEWFRGGGADGFNLMPPALPASLDAFVDHVVPELQRRGLFRREYAGTTLRQHLTG
ncbi:LLM class flavin-dependent oxidoreductase [Kineococcus esterisolvens]|uniref:LLM class flavin-dependent oxidoreductase n=1 Tax=unclassified Kineococcus TaxID=2621656 RepID=UPI003D7DE5F1